MGTDIGIIENHIVVADHLGYKYIKIKRTKLIDEIIQLTKKVTVENEIFDAVSEKYSYKEIKETLDRLLEYGVLEYSLFPNDVSIDDMKKYKMPEGAVSERFAVEIAALSKYEKRGYSRFDIFEKIRGAEVTIIGAGGVGSNLAVMLTAYGVKKITIIDNDYVELDNLVRQVFYREEDCGKEKKVNALKRFLNGFSTYTEIIAMEKFIMSEGDAASCLSDSQLVIQTADQPKGFIDFWVNKICVQKSIPILFTHNSSIGPFYIPGQSACFECFKSFLDTDSRGLYFQTIANLEENTGSVYPADIFGAWFIAYYLTKEVVDYIINIDKPKSMNSLVKVKEGKCDFITIDRKEGCICSVE